MTDLMGKPCGSLLELDGCALLFKLLLELLSLGLVNVLLDGLGGTLDQVLGFLQAQAGDLADHLDDRDLLVRRVLLQSDGELGLLLGRSRGGRARG